MESRHDYGHLDLSRMQAGNFGLQMFTSVTKPPSGQNYEYNEPLAGDNFTVI